MPGRPCDPVDTERLLQLARELADSDSGPASELGLALTAAVTALSRRVDELWDLIAAALDAAGLGSATGPPGAGPPAEFIRALTAPRRGEQGVRLDLGGGQWVAAISPEGPPADPGAAWAALERMTSAADEPADDSPAAEPAHDSEPTPGQR
jgi:hypothetical protein